MSTPLIPSHYMTVPEDWKSLGIFSCVPHVDIVFLTSDSHALPAQKSYVVDSSPVLGELITAETRHGAGLEATLHGATTTGCDLLLPVIQLPVSHATLSSLLTFVFPVPSFLPPTIEQILELLSVAQKYEMTTTLARIRDCASRRDPSFICAKTALHVYSLAWKYGLLEETLLAAEEALKIPMTIENFEDKLQFIPIPALCQLWKYRQKVLDDLSTNFYIGLSSSGAYQTLVNIDCVEKNTSSNVPLWLDHYLNSILKDPACVNLTTFHLALSSHVSSTDVETSSDGCKNNISLLGHTVDEFWADLRAVVHNSIKKANSDFSLTQEEIRAQSPVTATKGASPFPEGLNMQGADVVLQSSDLVSFRVHKSILAISSPFFNDLFSLPQPRHDATDGGLPIVQVPEDAELLHSLLTVLYPIPSVIPDSYEKTLTLLAALQKYDMDIAISTVRPEIGRQLPTTEAAFHAYAIASSKGLIPEMETAARLTLDHPMTFEVIANILSLFEGSALIDLVRFRKRCRANLLTFFGRFVRGDDSLTNAWCGCPKTKRPRSALQNSDGVLAGWLRTLLLRHIKRLREKYTTRSLPNRLTLRTELSVALRAHISETKCASCSMLYAADGEALRDQFLNRAQRARDEEPFRLNAGASNTSVDLGNNNV